MRFLRSSGYLIEDLGAGTWAKGAELDVPAAEWAEGRAQMILVFLQARGQDFDRVIRELPDEIGDGLKPQPDMFQQQLCLTRRHRCMSHVYG